MANAKKRAPAGLGPAGRALWNDVLKTYTLRVDEERILADACFERDLISRLEREMKTAETIVKGSMGQPTINPMISELRQHRGTFARLMGQLKLPDDAQQTSQPETRSTQARAAAQARWAQ